jgi:hypothetical protein
LSRLRVSLLLGAAAALAAVAAILALLASDVRAWHERIETGDLAYSTGAAAPQWRVDGSLPLGAARRLLGIDDDLAYREAFRLYRARNAAVTFDNSGTRRTLQAEAEIALARVEQADEGERASRAANLLGVLALNGPAAVAVGQPDPVDRALAEFRNAIRLDPGNEDAMFNLELLLHEIEARGERSGASAGESGRASGRRGAGASLPGQGY